jgi:ABC-type transport system involved in multi-copper enzyme maturation permease subunit
MINLAQIGAVAHTEFRFCLRRGGPIIGVVAAGFILTAGTLFLGVPNAEGLTPSAATQAGAQALAMAWPAFEWLALGLLPIVAAPAIPSDRQFGVFELLHSLPLTGGTYLIGKVLGTVAAVLGTGLLSLIVHLILHAIMVGSPQIDLYLKLTFSSGLPILLWATTAGILVSAGLQTRRSAILAGVLTGMAGLFIWNISSWFNLITGQSFAEQANRLSYQAISKFIFGQYGLLPPYVRSDPTVGSQALQSIAVAFLALLGIVAVARLALWRKEDF